MVELLGAVGVHADVVGGPASPEVVAVYGQLPDEVEQGSVVGVAAGLGTQDGHGVAADLVVVAVESGGAGVEEKESSGVGRSRGVVVEREEQCSAQGIGGEDVAVATQDERRCRLHGVE